MFSPYGSICDQRKLERAEKKRPSLEAVSARRNEGTSATRKTLLDDSSVPKRLRQLNLTRLQWLFSFSAYSFADTVKLLAFWNTCLVTQASVPPQTRRPRPQPQEVLLCHSPALPQRA